jgi:hypothetical protein
METMKCAWPVPLPLPQISKWHADIDLEINLKSMLVTPLLRTCSALQTCLVEADAARAINGTWAVR